MPCDEVLIWNYRSNAFSTWRPPSGLEIYWMRPLRDDSGDVRVCFLARDGRIYALDEAANDSAMTTTYGIEATVTARATDSTSLSFTLSGGTGQNGTAPTGHNGDRRHLRSGMLVEAIDASGNLVWDTTIASVTSVSASGGTIVLSAAQTWRETYSIRIGGRQRATIVSGYLGAEALDNLNVQATQMRYSLFGNGSAHAKVTLLKTELADTATAARSVAMVPTDAWTALGYASVTTSDETRIARRRRFAQGGADATEIAVKVELSGSAQARIEDIALEVQ
jgi:hypothetical protein